MDIMRKGLDLTNLQKVFEQYTPYLPRMFCGPASNSNYWHLPSVYELVAMVPNYLNAF